MYHNYTTNRYLESPHDIVPMLAVVNMAAFRGSWSTGVAAVLFLASDALTVLPVLPYHHVVNERRMSVDEMTGILTRIGTAELGTGQVKRVAEAVDCSRDKRLPSLHGPKPAVSIEDAPHVSLRELVRLPFGVSNRVFCN